MIRRQLDNNTGAIDANPPMDGVTMIDSAQSGVVPDCVDLEHDGRLYFDAAGDVDRLAGRGVGFPECEFDLGARGNQGRPSIVDGNGPTANTGSGGGSRRRGRRRKRR